MPNSDYKLDCAIDWCVEKLEDMNISDISKVIEFIKGGLNINYIMPTKEQFDDLVQVYETDIEILLKDKSELSKQVNEHYGKPTYWKYKNELGVVNTKIDSIVRQLGRLKYKARLSESKKTANKMIDYLKTKYPGVYLEIVDTVIKQDID